MAAPNRQIRLNSRPVGAPRPDNFDAVDAAMPIPGDDGVLRRTIYLSLDPYMRGRMSDAKSYAAPVGVGDVMCGHTVSQVVESRHPDFRAGDFVAGYDGGQQYAASNGRELRKLDPALAPISTAIGVLGMPGMTAYVTIPIAEAKNVVKIPNGALRFKPDLSDEEIKALYTKFKVPYEDPRARQLAAVRGQAAPGGGSSGGARSGQSGGEAAGSPEGGEGARAAGGAGRRMGGSREEWSVAWKLLPDKSLQPMRVRLGVTDFTFTQMLAGDLQPADELVIGQTSSRSSSQLPGPQQRSPMMGPRGMPH